MEITLRELKAMVKEAVKSKLNEGPQEIPIRMTMEDLKEPIIGSIIEDLVRNSSLSEKEIESVVVKAYEKMTIEIIRGLDIAKSKPAPSSRPSQLGNKHVFVRRSSESSR